MPLKEVENSILHKGILYSNCCNNCQKRIGKSYWIKRSEEVICCGSTCAGEWDVVGWEQVGEECLPAESIRALIWVGFMLVGTVLITAFVCWMIWG